MDAKELDVLWQSSQIRVTDELAMACSATALS
mgnify:CR=1 FL=1